MHLSANSISRRLTNILITPDKFYFDFTTSHSRLQTRLVFLKFPISLKNDF